MNRRTLLAIGSAALIPGGSTAAIANGESEVRRLYREWRASCDLAEDRSISEEEVERHVARCHLIEEQIYAAPTLSAEDLAVKIMIASCAWDCVFSPDCTPGLCQEIKELAGVRI